MTIPVTKFSGVLILRTVDEQRAGGDQDPVDVESLRLPDGAVPVLIDFNRELPIGEAFVHRKLDPVKGKTRASRLYADITLVAPLEDQRWPSIAITGFTQAAADRLVTNARLIYVGLVARQNTDTGLGPLN
jgi:hypothetical protein